MKRSGLCGRGEMIYKNTWSLYISVTVYWFRQGSKLFIAAPSEPLLSNVLQPKPYCFMFLIKDLVLLQYIASKKYTQAWFLDDVFLTWWLTSHQPQKFNDNQRQPS